mgnify:CR=1 FL=1
MAVNKYKETASTPSPSKKKKKRSSKRVGLNINAFYLFENIHFIFYLAFLGVIYIANSHYAVQTIKDIKNLQFELRKISWESNSKKSDLMFQSMESVVAQKVEHLGLVQQSTNPKKIKNKSSYND